MAKKPAFNVFTHVHFTFKYTSHTDNTTTLYSNIYHSGHLSLQHEPAYMYTIL